MTRSAADPDPARAEAQRARGEAIRAVIESCMARRAAGEMLSDSAVVGLHPGLMPELGRELGLLAMIERARSRVGSRVESRTGMGGGARPGSRYEMPAEMVTGQPTVEDGESPPGYDLIREVHRGGQGVVHEAIQRATGRRVAVKVRHESLLPGSAGIDRFEREVEILAQLDHPNIVGVIGSGVHRARPYCVMAYVDGPPVDEFLARTPLDVEGTLRLFERIASAVGAAHVRGVIHRDLKPANILIDASGEPRLVDFGLARLTEGRGAERTRTLAGQFLGSVPWASPEQAAGDPARIDVRSDVYSLGVVLFQMLTGVLPYRLPGVGAVGGSDGSGGLREALGVITSAAPARPSSLRKGLDPDIDTIVLKCLAKEPSRRYQSAGELAEDVRRCLEHRPIAARPPSLSYQLRRFARRHRAIVGAGAAVGVALGAGFVSTLVQLDRARGAERVASAGRAEAERQGYIANIFAADAALKAHDGRTAAARLGAAPAGRRGWEWDYLHGLTDASEQWLTFEPPQPVMVLAPLGAGEGAGGVLTLGVAGTLARWDTAARAPAWSVPTDGIGRGLVLAASADGSRAAVLSAGAGAVHDTATGRELRRFDFGEGAGAPTVGCASLSGDGGLLAVGGRDSFGVRVYDTETGEQVSASGELFAHVRDVDISRDGEFLASVELPEVVVRAVATGRERLRLPLGSARFEGRSSVRVSPDGGTIAASRIEAILLFDAADGRKLGELRGHTRFVRALRFSPDGRLLVSCSEDATVRVWDVKSGECRRVLIGHGATPVSACFEGSTGEVYSASSEEPSVRRWGEDAGLAATPIALAPDGWPLGFAAGAGARAGGEGAGGGGRLIMAEGTAVHTQGLDGSGREPLLDPGAVEDNFADEERRVLATVGTDRALTVRSLVDGRVIAPRPGEAPIVSPGGDIRAVSPDGRYIAVADRADRDRGPIWVVRTEDGGRSRLEVPGGLIGNVHFAGPPEGRVVITAAGDWVVRVWDARTGAERTPLYAADSETRTHGIAAHPDGRRVATANAAGAVRVWDLASGRELVSVPGQGTPIFELAYTPGGRRLLAGGVDGKIRVFDPETGDMLLALPAHETLIESMVLSADGSRLLTVGHDRRALVWEARGR